jgi:UDP-glucose 4-epimerase
LNGHHLILGGCGFIGRHVAIGLARKGHTVVVADRTKPAFHFPTDIDESISWERFELASADWDGLISDAEVIHHYAWTSIPASANANPIGDLTSNVTSTLALLDALHRRGGGRVLFASSGGTVYGKVQEVPITEDHPLLPITAYGAGKVAAEVYLGLYRSLYGVDCRIARIANPFGAGQDIARGQGAATKFLHSALTNQEIVIWGDGTVVRDYIHISDVTDALVSLALVQDLRDFYVFNIGSGCGTSLNAIISELEQHLQKTVMVRREAGRAFDVPINVLDISRAREILGWQPFLGFAKGLKLTLKDLANDVVFSTVNCRA